MTDLRTNLQKFRDERAARVEALFLQLKDDTNGSMNAILNHISNKLSEEGMPITPMGVKGILIRKNLYKLS